MLLVLALAITVTVAITTYALSRGRSPVWWGGASLLMFAAAFVLAHGMLAFMGTTDLVFASHGGAVVMLAEVAVPVVALLGNGVLASRLAALPIVRPSTGSSWMMWRLSDAECDEGYACMISLDVDSLRISRDAEPSLSIPFTRLSVRGCARRRVGSCG